MNVKSYLFGVVTGVILTLVGLYIINVGEKTFKVKI